MFNNLLVKIFVPIVVLMVALSASLYFVVLRTVNEFAQQNIEKDFENLTHDLFDIVDNQFMHAIKTGRADDRVAIRISQVDCLDILERNTYSGNYTLVVYEKKTGTIRLESGLPAELPAKEILQRFQAQDDDSLLKIGDEEFHARQFYFSPWDWGFLVLKNTLTYSELSHKVQQVYLTTAIVLLVATILLVLYLFRNIKRPISSIISSVSQGKSPEYQGTYEFEFLSNAIGDMRSSLKNEVAERQRAEKEAESASRAKSQFLANMSHELRTPLNAILGFAQIMERNRTNPTDEENLRIIQRSGYHLLTLINQVLDLSKIEAGHITLETSCFDLFHLLDELKNMLLLKADKKELVLSFDIHQEVPRYICTDEIKLRQILINLISNAIKFTDKGFVNVKTSLKDDKDLSIQPINKKSRIPLVHRTACLLDFTIEDSGLGISSEEITQLFEAFGQTSSGKQVGEGTGLGLVISKKFIDLLGGNMHLTSEPGKGSTFSFTIPVQLGKEMNASLPITTARITGLEPGQPAYRMLIVDDNQDNRQLIVRLLEPFGFEIQEAGDGQQAIDIQQDWEPHLIWMDIRMPVMDGLEATKKIRSKSSSSLQPVIIAVTASVLESKLKILLTEGCDDIVLKPFKDNDLFEMLRKHLNVRFIYEGEQFNGQSRDADAEILLLSASDLSALPEEMTLRLKKSISALKMNAALDVIKEIRGQNEALASTLEQMVQEYRFDKVMELLEHVE